MRYGLIAIVDIETGGRRCGVPRSAGGAAVATRSTPTNGTLWTITLHPYRILCTFVHRIPRTSRRRVKPAAIVVAGAHTVPSRATAALLRGEVPRRPRSGFRWRGGLPRRTSHRC